MAFSAPKRLSNPAVADVLSLALNDNSERVRNRVMDTIRQQEGDLQLSALAAAMSSGYEDVKTEALSLLELRGDHKSVPIIIDGLKDSNPEYREEVNSVLSALIDQEFSSYDKAIKWWNKNKDRYDNDLFEK